MADAPDGPRGTISAALAHGARLLASKPALAEAQAREILSVVPDQAEALCLLGGALRAQGNAVGAIAVLSPAAKQNPKSAALNFELGLAHAEAGAADAAIEALRTTVRFEPRHPHAWRALGDQLTQCGDAAAAEDAYARHIGASTNNPQLLEAAAALCENKLAIAERLLREFLKAHPTDVAAIRMLAETGTRLGRLDDAERLLARCLELAPSFAEARHHYALVLHRQNKPMQALRELQILLVEDPRNPNYRGLKAAALGRIGQYDEAIGCYQSLLTDFPTQSKAWMSYGHALKTVGRTDEAIAAYRKSVALMPHLGEAYWSLANLKTFRFAPEDIAAMRGQLDRPELEEEERIHLHFAVGKALEDAREYDASFAQYARGNELRRRTLPYSAEDITGLVERSKGLFTTEFFEERCAFGSPAPDPIFVVGLTRSGSTLIEQILSSHSMVEGTMELPDILTLTKRFGLRKGEGGQLYPAGLELLSAEDCLHLGEEYLSRTRVQRRQAKPYFIDKLPNNWSNIGFIHLILPNARIIDARRHPLACCFSNFKQLFARGQGFSYDLTDCGRYYRDYVELMAHLDKVLPGRIHRVLYEELVRDPEREIRSLLDHCGLPFESQCLRFYESERAVRTASSEQVRQPLYAEGLHQWQNFEPWLGPLKAALGATLEAYPNAPRSLE